MSFYGVLYPEFWDGDTGRAIAAGGCAAQVVAVYLTANQDTTMIGLYPLELVVMRARLRTLSQRPLERALAFLEEVGFAAYDAASQHVWVYSLAKYRLGLHLKALAPSDNRVAHVRRLYEGLRPNPFLGPFYDRYHAALHLRARRASKALPSPFEGPFEGLERALIGSSKGLQGAFRGPSKPVTGTETDPGTETGTDPETEQQDQNHRAGRGPHAPDADDNPRVLVKLAHLVLEDVDRGDLDPREIVDELKDRAAKAGLRRDQDRIRQALDVADAQRAHRSRRA